MVEGFTRGKFEALSEEIQTSPVDWRLNSHGPQDVFSQDGEKEHQSERNSYVGDRYRQLCGYHMDHFVCGEIILACQNQALS